MAQSEDTRQGILFIGGLEDVNLTRSFYELNLLEQVKFLDFRSSGKPGAGCSFTEDESRPQLRKADVVQALKQLFQRDDLTVKTVYYSGYGETDGRYGESGTGNWCFNWSSSDNWEVITFEEVMDLFQTHSRNRARLDLVLDTSWSGVWVKKAQERNSAAQIFASCREDEHSCEDESGAFFLKDWVDALSKGGSIYPLFEKCFPGYDDRLDRKCEQHPQAWVNGKRIGL